MILSGEQIRQALRSGEIEVSPAPEEAQYSSSALDLTLGDEFLRWDETRLGLPGVSVEIDVGLVDYVKLARSYSLPVPREADGSVIMPPHSFVLAITLERVKLPLEGALAARVEGRSSMARMGLQVHLTAPIIHAGWNGQITLELVNHGPFNIKLRPRRHRICQVVFERLGTAATQPPPTRFLGQSSPAGT